MATTYSSPVTIRQWANPTVAPFRLYDITPYKNGSEVSADTVSDISDPDVMENTYKVMVESLKYDSVIVQERILVIPS